jgi:hemin uptake protein HemP
MPGVRLADRPSAAPNRSEVEPATALPGGQPAVPSATRWDSAVLFGPAQEIEIEHGQAVYRLRLTALGKLILTK